jgi:predicted dehydrogenase
MSCLRFAAALVFSLVVLCVCDVVHAKDEVLRAGIIGCDTSHVIAFTDLINNPAASGPLANVEVTVAYPGGSPDLPVSRDRLPGYVEQLRKKRLKIVDSLEDLAEQSDVILLESVDGRPHLEQFKAVARGKPVFVDKPAAASLADVIAIFRHAEATKTPVFSSSSLRFFDEFRTLAKDPALGELLGCESTGPLHIEKHHPDLFWYGVHGVETLYAVMGTGCKTVTRVDTKDSSLVVGEWVDGKIGSFRGMKVGAGYYGATAYGTKAVIHRGGVSGYEPAMRVICEFFLNGKPPVSSEETIELFAFMEAADESKRQGGKSVAIADVMQKAEQELAAGAGE